MEAKLFWKEQSSYSSSGSRDSGTNQLEQAVDVSAFNQKTSELGVMVAFLGRRSAGPGSILSGGGSGKCDELLLKASCMGHALDDE